MRPADDRQPKAAIAGVIDRLILVKRTVQRLSDRITQVVFLEHVVEARAINAEKRRGRLLVSACAFERGAHDRAFDFGEDIEALGTRFGRVYFIDNETSELFDT